MERKERFSLEHAIDAGWMTADLWAAICTSDYNIIDRYAERASSVHNIADVGKDKGELSAKQWRFLNAACVPAVFSADDSKAEPESRKQQAALEARNAAVSSVTNAQRGSIRKAITATDAWSLYRDAMGIKASDLSNTDQLRAAANACGVDMQATIDAHNNAARAGSDAFNNIGKKDDDAPSNLGAGMAARIEESRVREIARDEAKKIWEPEPEKVVVVVNKGNKTKRKVEGRQHKNFPELLSLCAMRDHKGIAFGVLLSGPAATGKTQACAEVAKAFGVDFEIQGTALETFDILGFVDGHGKYHETAFIRALRKPCIMLLDEGDAWDANALLAANSILANGYAMLPNGEKVERHKDCVFVMAANTKGHGATAEYSSRNKLDGATLSRFPFVVDWQPDAEMELGIISDMTGGNAQALAWCREVQFARTALAELGMPALADLRNMLAGAALIVDGFKVERVRELTYTAALDEDQRSALLSKVTHAIARAA